MHWQCNKMRLVWGWLKHHLFHGKLNGGFAVCELCLDAGALNLGHHILQLLRLLQHLPVTSSKLAQYPVSNMGDGLRRVTKRSPQCLCINALRKTFKSSIRPQSGLRWKVRGFTCISSARTGWMWSYRKSGCRLSTQSSSVRRPWLTRVWEPLSADTSGSMSMGRYGKRELSRTGTVRHSSTNRSFICCLWRPLCSIFKPKRSKDQYSRRCFHGDRHLSYLFLNCIWFGIFNRKYEKNWYSFI